MYHYNITPWTNIWQTENPPKIILFLDTFWPGAKLLKKNGFLKI